MAYCSPCSGLMHCVTNSSSLIGCSVLRVNSDRHTLTGREVGFSYSTAVETTVTMQESSSPALERYWCTFTQYAKWYDAAHLYPTWHHHHHHHGLARVHAAVISSQSQRQQGHHNRTTAAPEPCMAKGCRTEGGGCLGHRIYLSGAEEQNRLHQRQRHVNAMTQAMFAVALQSSCEAQMQGKEMSRDTMMPLLMPTAETLCRLAGWATWEGRGESCSSCHQSVHAALSCRS